MSTAKRFTNATGAPVADNTNIMTAGPRRCIAIPAKGEVPCIEPPIPSPEQMRSRSVTLLNRHLAAAIDLHAQVEQAHWNVRGPTFIVIHELFDKIADVIEEYSDKIAERAGTLGGTAEGTVQPAAQRSFLHPCRLRVADAAAHIAAVTERWQPSANRCAARSTTATRWATSTPPTCSPRSRAVSITSSGWSSSRDRSD